jgi:hypothetical protein
MITMKKHNYFVTLLFGSAIAFTAISCNEGDPKPEVIKPGADDLVNLVFEENLEDMKQAFSLNSETGGDIIGTQGTTIRFFANGFLKSNGDAVTGNVDVKLIELYKKSDMLLTKMPTQGKTDDGKIALLVSGGEFYINATQNGEQLKPNGNYMIIAPTETTGGEDTDMKPFEGVEECDNDGCEVVWKQQDRDIKIGAADGQGGLIESAYQVFQSQFGWTNIDRWYSDPRDKTTIFVDVPEGYDNTNCAVYLSYDGEGSALALFDTYNAGTGLFTEHYGLIPIGLEVHFIMVSVIDDQWYYSIHAATIGANHVETFTTLQPTTEAELTALVDALP